MQHFNSRGTTLSSCRRPLVYTATASVLVVLFFWLYCFFCPTFSLMQVNQSHYRHWTLLWWWHRTIWRQRRQHGLGDVIWKYDVRMRNMISTSQGSSRLGNIFTGPYNLKHLYFGSPVTARIWRGLGSFLVFTMIATYLLLCCTCRSNNFHFAHSNSNAIVKTSRFWRLWYSQTLAGSKYRRKSCHFLHTCSWYPALRMVVFQGSFYRPSVKRNVEYSCIFS